MAAACHQCVPCERNPGLWLGLVAGEAARGGWDKLTLGLPADVAALGQWVEQLVAESTGKDGSGILPVVDEDLGAPRGATAPTACSSPCASSTGWPTWTTRAPRSSRLGRREPVLLGAEMFRWEFAVAVAGHVLGVNPFDQPDVDEEKAATRRILAHDDPRRHVARARARRPGGGPEGHRPR